MRFRAQKSEDPDDVFGWHVNRGSDQNIECYLIIPGCFRREEMARYEYRCKILEKFHNHPDQWRTRNRDVL